MRVFQVRHGLPSAGKGCTLTDERSLMQTGWCYAMDRDEFAARVVGMRDTLYRVSATLLRREADREDAISEAIAKALVKLPGASTRRRSNRGSSAASSTSGS